MLLGIFSQFAAELRLYGINTDLTGRGRARVACGLRSGDGASAQIFQSLTDRLRGSKRTAKSLSPRSTGLNGWIARAGHLVSTKLAGACLGRNKGVFALL